MLIARSFISLSNLRFLIQFQTIVSKCGSYPDHYEWCTPTSIAGTAVNWRGSRSYTASIASAPTGCRCSCCCSSNVQPTGVLATAPTGGHASIICSGSCHAHSHCRSTSSKATGRFQFNERLNGVTNSGRWCSWGYMLFDYVNEYKSSFLLLASGRAPYS
jgi:hypothetical protein